MSTVVCDPQKLRLAATNLALNGWVGMLPTAHVAISTMTAPLTRNSAICKSAPADEGQQAPLTNEPATHQD